MASRTADNILTTMAQFWNVNISWSQQTTNVSQLGNDEFDSWQLLYIGRLLKILKKKTKEMLAYQEWIIK